MIRSVDFPVDPRVIRNPTNSPLATKGARMAAAARTRLCIETIGLILSEHFAKPGRFFTTTRQQATSINAIEAMPGAEGWTVPNRWTVRLTRISMGTVDPITGGATMKAVQDAVARWCDVPSEQDPIWHWVEPIGQEKRGFVKGADGKKRAWTGVRIELEDLAPGEPRRVVLATIAGFEVRAKAAIKERAKAAKMRGRTQVYHAAEGQKAASSAARKRADDAFAKVTGKAPTPLQHPTLGPVNVEASGDLVLRAKAPTPRTPKAAPAGSEDASPRMLIRCPVHNVEPGIVCPGSKNGACAQRARLAGLASAGARVLGPKPATGPKKKAQRIPEDLAAMRAQARSVACAVCGAGYVDGPPCVNVPEAVRCPTCGTNWGAFAEGRCMVCLDCPGNVRLERYAPPFEYGVHASRARAAGLPPFPCVVDLDAGAKPMRVESKCTLCGGDGFRMRMIEGPQPCRCDLGKVSTWTWLPGRGAEVWLILPWNVRECGLCGGVGQEDDGAPARACTGCNGTGRKPLFTRAKDVADPPPKVLRYLTPTEHLAAHGRAVTLHRTTITTRPKGEQPGRLAWLFTTEERTRS